MGDTGCHALSRTSPKGQPFIGVCMKCGIPGLALKDVVTPCVNPAGLDASETFELAMRNLTKDQPHD